MTEHSIGAATVRTLMDAQASIHDGAEAVQRAAIARLERQVHELRRALIPFAFIGRRAMEDLGLGEEHAHAYKLLGLDQTLHPAVDVAKMNPKEGEPDAS